MSGGAIDMVKGYKVFNSQWQCRGKIYTCPGKFEEDVIPSVCESGMHFCKVAANCFNYYDFTPCNKVAEVIAYGDVAEVGDKCCTNKLEIVREIPWSKLLEIVNTGEGCTGKSNTGDYNSGFRNSGHWNSGNRNSGAYNTGSFNSGNGNSGDWNTGDWNTGNYNQGNFNSGNYNIGSWNSGHYNIGNCNSGDWNGSSFSNGCFNTKVPKILLFNKFSNWTYQDWILSEARNLLNQMPSNVLEYRKFYDMRDDDKKEHPEAEVTGGYLKKVSISMCRTIWWHILSEDEKAIIKAIPNFDKEIFKEITGIDIEENIYADKI